MSVIRLRSGAYFLRDRFLSKPTATASAATSRREKRRRRVRNGPRRNSSTSKICARQVSVRRCDDALRARARQCAHRQRGCGRAGGARNRQAARPAGRGEERVLDDRGGSEWPRGARVDPSRAGQSGRGGAAHARSWSRWPGRATRGPSSRRRTRSEVARVRTSGPVRTARSRCRRGLRAEFACRPGRPPFHCENGGPLS